MYCYTRQQSNTKPQGAVEPQIYYGKPQSCIKLKSCIKQQDTV